MTEHEIHKLAMAIANALAPHIATLEDLLVRIERQLKLMADVE
jgi:hypothetical protein